MFLRFWPFYGQFGPQIFRQHPTETGEKIGAVQKIAGRLIDISTFSIVIPRRNTPAQ